VEEHRELAAELTRVVKRGVIVDIPNPRFLESALAPESSRVVANHRIEERRRLLNDPRRVVKRVRIHDLKGVLVQEYEERVMLFSQATFVELFEAAGLSVTGMYGDYEGSPFREEESPRQLGRFERVGSRV
jgi:hypothetical protein